MKYLFLLVLSINVSANVQSKTLEDYYDEYVKKEVVKEKEVKPITLEEYFKEYEK